MTAIYLFCCMMVTLGVLLYADFECSHYMILVFKTISSLLFILTGFFSAKFQRKNKFSWYTRFILIGLLFSLGGDFFLALDTNKGIFFIIGVISFALAHISYMAGFFQYDKLEKLNVIWSIIIFTPLFLLMTFSGLFRFDGLYPIVIFYAVLLSCMVANSFSLWKYRHHHKRVVYMTLAGTLMFLISDYILLFSFFMPSFPAGPGLVFNNSIYYIGQGILALSLKYYIPVEQK